MSSSEAAVAAIDLGATSGRVIIGTVEDQRLRLDHVARFPNTPVRLPDGLHWDVLSLYSGAMRGLGTASRQVPLVGAAVDSWAVDFGLVTGRRLLGNPFHYRDARNERAVATVHAQVPAPELFGRNGLQHLPFNTVFQLLAAAHAGELETAERMLLIPDLFGYWITGEQVAERTNASTTGLLQPGAADWDHELLAKLGLRSGLFPRLVEPGTRLGEISTIVRDEFGIYGNPVMTAVGSHDTASAVVGVPLSSPDAAYISCGTWSLIGTELPHPILSDEARTTGFTNEGGVGGRTRFLKNVMGLWVLSESVRAWEKVGEVQELGILLRQAAEAPADVPVFDANDPRLLAPGDMPSRIKSLLIESGQRVPSSIPEFVRSVLQSLANAYAETLQQLEVLTRTTVPAVHLVGGGAQNALLCQLTADATGVPVIAGPVEATAIGNLLIQLRTHGALHGDLDTLRQVSARSFPPHTYRPRPRSSRG